MTRAALALLYIVALATARGAATDDWAAIVAMDKNPPADHWTSREEAQSATLDYLAKQETILRNFIATYPQDPHTPDARLRLAHLLATRADLQQDDAGRRAADSLLDDIESDPAMRDRRADVEFARISIFMQRVDAISGANRDTLLDKSRAFAKAFPDDRRVAPLLAEVASAFDDSPSTARSLLEQAQIVARTDEIKARIADDLKRLDMLGKPVAMKWTSVQGPQIDLKKLRGKVVLVYFFASWSPPSMAELTWVKQLATSLPADAIQPLGICLDPDPYAVPAMLSDQGIDWPTFCDGRRWQGTLVRSLGINEIPELWIIDRRGILRSLDAKQDAVDLIQNAARDTGM
jgi:thiol-disulfide isomerase/thioredoxin